MDLPATRAGHARRHPRAGEGGGDPLAGHDLVGPVLTATDFSNSRLYDPDFSHRFRKAKHHKPLSITE
ncbi:MAG: hypothetical protein ACREXM_04220 [Gammaproteobacteria bacterium]